MSRVTEEIHTALDRFDTAFAAGDADALAEAFAEDARLLLLHAPPIEGRAAIREHWARTFATYDTAAWRTERERVDVHASAAYALSSYTETLVQRDGKASLLVRGRLIQFLRRDTDGVWRVTLAMNSHSTPTERVGT